MKNAIWRLLLIGAIGNSLAAPTLYAAAGTGEAAKASYVEGFDVRRPPAPADWRYFLKSPASTRAKLWAYHSKRGVTLGQWAWGWRLGWVRACGASQDAYCADVLQAALFDKALVVRSEAATHIGRRHEGSSDAAALALLERAYSDPRNMRGGKPIFVQERILFAMHRIGGQQAELRGKTLADRHPQLATYWSRLGRATVQ
jgi:hypothetical protein